MRKTYIILFIVFSVNFGFSNNINSLVYSNREAIIVPTFNSVGPICSGADIADLPTTSLNGITGTWSPAIDNTVTTTYTFTPNPGQDAVDTTLVIEVIPNATTTIFCEQILPTVLRIDWAPIGSFNQYEYSYSIDGGTPVTGTASVSNFTIPNFLTGQTITFTLTNAQGVTCFQPISTTCGTLNTIDFDDISFDYSPNPVTDILNINSKNTINNVEVFNILGQRVLYNYCDTKSLHLNMTDLDSGFYIIKINSDKATSTFKVLKN